jgi:hypothetical protein
MVIISMLSGGGPSRKPTSNDPLAKRYCFKATTTMHRRGQPLGTFTAYDYRIQVAEEVQKACEKQCLNCDDGHCDAVELTMLSECPVELRDEIYFEFFK